MSPFVAAERRRGRGRGRTAIRGRSRRGSLGPEALQQEQNLDGVPLDAATLLSQPRVCPPPQIHFAMTQLRQPCLGACVALDAACRRSPGGKV